MIKEYVGENLAPGHWGYFFVVLSFCAALLGLAAYIFYTRKPENKGWRSIARTAFFIHGASVLGIFITLFYLIYTHQFQYNYVWSHSSLDLSAKYMISCFWEGQEGSFLLWTFWHVFIGIILIFSTRSWEGPVMITMCLAQVMLASMLLGVDEVNLLGLHFHMPLKLGSNPFILLREAFPDLPLFNITNDAGQYIYTEKLGDGRGLNVLLQNYWMVIHPPVLFLGFASTIVPFAFAIGSLINKQYTLWVRPAMPWVVFGCMILGTGILMGGAWAYEALSFGGFWAWDPVENASLVPWLIFIAGLHTMLIYRARKSALGASYIFISLTFLLILYSTFLTRSGILGDSSVHSFTDLGLSGQLLIFMGAFILLALVLLVMRWKHIPKTEKEESTYSREFWLFIGSLIISLSALHIISITSIPVLNKINGLINELFSASLRTNYAKPSDVIKTYHMLQIPFAIIIALLTATAQYMNYVITKAKPFWRQIGIAAAIASIITLVMALVVELTEPLYLIMLWASAYAAAGNAGVFIRFARQKNLRISGSAVAHMGFGVLLMGALISNARKETISLNTERIQVLQDATPKENFENKVLFKDLPVKMADYMVTYKGDSVAKDHLYFQVSYNKIDSTSGDTVEKFDLYPYLVRLKGKQEFTSTSPSTRHYLTKDIFTHITSAADKNLPEYQVKYDTVHNYIVAPGQIIKLDSFTITVNNINKLSELKGKAVTGMEMPITVTDGAITYHPIASWGLDSSGFVFHDAAVDEFGLKFRFVLQEKETAGVSPDFENKLIVFKGKRPPLQFISLKATIFPYINLLWIGAIIMVIGFSMAIARRIRDYQLS